MHEVLDQHGRLDILVNNAGITIDKMAMQMSVEDWDTVLAVNLPGPSTWRNRRSSTCSSAAVAASSSSPP